jgi:hypothetical protein
MKNLYSDLHPDCEAPGNGKTHGTGQRKKIRIAFENDVSTRDVKIQIRHGYVPAKISMLEPKNHNSLAYFSAVRAMS